MKISKLVYCLLVFILPAMFFSCAEEDEIILKRDNQITAITAQSRYAENYGDAPKEYQGQIDEQQNTVYFDVLTADNVDITSMYVKVNLPVGAKLESAIQGPKDLSKPYNIVVIAENGTKRTYSLLARYI